MFRTSGPEHVDAQTGLGQALRLEVFKQNELAAILRISGQDAKPELAQNCHDDQVSIAWAQRAALDFVNVVCSPEHRIPLGAHVRNGFGFELEPQRPLEVSNYGVQVLASKAAVLRLDLLV